MLTICINAYMKKLIHKPASKTFTIACLILGCLTGYTLAMIILINFC